MARRKSPAQMVRELKTLRDKIGVQSKRVTELKAKRDTIELALIELLKKDEMTSLGTGNLTATYTRRPVPVVKDWDDFYDFIRENDAMFLLERRPSPTAYRDVLESRDGKKIPGVETFHKESISIRTKS